MSTTNTSSPTVAKGIVIMVIARGKGWVVQEAVSRVQPPGEDWRVVGKRSGGFIWHRRVACGQQQEVMNK